MGSFYSGSDRLLPDETRQANESKNTIKFIEGLKPFLALIRVSLYSALTLFLTWGMVFSLVLAIILNLSSNDLNRNLILGLSITLGFSLVSFLFAARVMDWSQEAFYQTSWVDLDTISERSPKTAEIIQKICAEKGLKEPRFGLINDLNPTAFTYGTFNNARVVVSEGIFNYLDEDEIAAVFAHEMGHIVHWDFVVMTIASTFVHICYITYQLGRTAERTKDELDVAYKSEDSQGKNALFYFSWAAYLCYWVGHYLLLNLSRVREYAADRFAAQVTGNPNHLSHALVKIAYGIVQEARQTETPSQLLEGVRAFCIYDHKSALMAGTAYCLDTTVTEVPKRKKYDWDLPGTSSKAESVPQLTENHCRSSQDLTRIFTWDLFSPWAWWHELNSTHPLTGKRIRALTNYAEQLDLPVEFDMAQVARDGKDLSKLRLYGGFILDTLVYWIEFIGLIIGVVLSSQSQDSGTFIIMTFCGLGIGLVIKALVLYPSAATVQETKVKELLADPYASPLRGKPVQLTGKLIGRNQAGYIYGSGIKFQDSTGLLSLSYASRFGPIGNCLVGFNQDESLMGKTGTVTGWFRHGVFSYLDLIQIQCDNGKVVRSHHRFWIFLLAFSTILVGLFWGYPQIGVTL